MLQDGRDSGGRKAIGGVDIDDSLSSKRGGCCHGEAELGLA